MSAHRGTQSSRSTDRRPPSAALAAVLFVALGLAVVAAPDVRAATITDQGISDAVEDELIFDRSVRFSGIDVRTHERIVTLSGTVDNVLAKERAARIAETVRGVRAVVNLIEVTDPWDRSDWRIQRDIEDALLYDQATEAFEIDVAVNEKVATLRGMVDSWQEKQLAGKIAKGVRSVTDVDNRIDVHQQGERTDAAIRAEVLEALRWDVLVDHELIDVTVEDGGVTLSGVVGSAAEKRLAAIDAWVRGVIAVDSDELTVEDWAENVNRRKKLFVVKDEEQLAKAVEDALLYDPRVASYQVSVSATGNVVTLRGKVGTVKAKHAAEQAARYTVGVSRVENRLRVRPEAVADPRLAERIRQAFLRDPHLERFEIAVTVVDGTARLAGTVDSFFERGRAEDVASRIAGVRKVVNTITVEDHLNVSTYDPYVYDYYPYYYTWHPYVPAVTTGGDEEIAANIKDELFWSPFVDAGEVEVSVDNGTATLSGMVDSWSERRAAVSNAFEGGATWVVNDLEVK